MKDQERDDNTTASDNSEQRRRHCERMMKCEDQVGKWKLWKGTLTTIGRYEKHQPNLRYTDSGSLMPRGVSRCRMGIAK